MGAPPLGCGTRGPWTHHPDQRTFSWDPTRGTARTDRDLVFASVTGAVLDADNFTRSPFKLHVECVELPKVGFHGHRRARATLLPTGGVGPNPVAETLGRDNTSAKMDTCSRVLTGMGDAAVG